MRSIILKDGRERTFHAAEIMGIINATDDSFFSGSRASSVEAALKKAEEMAADGAVILDVGGESTRPGSLPVTAEEEKNRICPVIRAIRERFPDILISADTYRASTASAAIEAGADIINDISGLTADAEMIPLLARTGVPVVIMHSKGTPEHMQDDPQYENVVEEVYSFLKDRIEAAQAGGISKKKIIADVGIGFGKTLAHNLALLQNIGRFHELDVPHLMAVSRKTWIGMLLEKDGAALPPQERLFGTIAASLYAVVQNIELIRVHDVKENAQAIRVFKKLLERTAQEQEETDVVIALGSNMGDKREYLERAISLMDEKAGTVQKRSRILETKAFGITEQDDFLNMAVLLRTSLKPYELLDVLHEIENELGRVRKVHWGPRTIDLDIIFYGNLILNDQDLTIPHPDYSNRDFVLKPLMDIVPDFTDPVTGRKICEICR